MVGAVYPLHRYYKLKNFWNMQQMFSAEKRTERQKALSAHTDWRTPLVFDIEEESEKKEELHKKIFKESQRKIRKILNFNNNNTTV